MQAHILFQKSVTQTKFMISFFFVYSGERPFECDICQKRFTLKHSMMRHRRKHLGQPEAETFSGSDEDTSVSEEPVPGRPVRTTYEAEMKPATWEMPGPSVSKVSVWPAAISHRFCLLIGTIKSYKYNLQICFLKQNILISVETAQVYILNVFPLRFSGKTITMNLKLVKN